MYRDHELIVRVWRADHLDGPWAWQCSSEHCPTPTGNTATHAEALQAACWHLGEAFDHHHQVDYVYEGEYETGSDSRATRRCGYEVTDRRGNSAERGVEYHFEWAEEDVPAAYRKTPATA